MPQPVAPIIVQPFAKNAVDPDYLQLPIPLTTADPGRASYDLGFPPLTMTEILAGGKPPFGQDMNGILYTATAHLAALQAGQLYKYDASVAGAMGGYQRGAVLAMSDNLGLWINDIQGNNSDPDANGVGWLPVFCEGVGDVAGLTGGTTVLTAATTRRSVIRLAGNLAGNAVVVLPSNNTTTFRRWLVVNNCVTNGFSVTVKTSAGGFGVVVPAGGQSAPTEVYGDSTDMYPVVAPITLPTDVNPTPNTIALRTNNGYLFATYFNQSSGPEVYSAVGVYGSAGDGYHRLLPLANLAAQISLASFAGQVVPAQVPAGAVTQYAPLLWNNAALAGTPTAPTQAAATNNTTVATTAFVQSLLGSSIGGTGYVRIGPSLILQWGQRTFGDLASGPIGTNEVTEAFPLAFPNGCLAVITSPTGDCRAAGSYARSLGAASFRLGMQEYSGLTQGVSNGAMWLAIGY